MEYITYYDSPIGNITLASNGVKITGLWFDSQKPDESLLTKNYIEGDVHVFDQAIEWLDIYFTGKDPGFMPPLNVNTTPFRQRVCEIMLTIPYGETITYGEIAKKLAEENGIEKMSAQAVGSAVGHNPISIMIPCHRVIGANKTIGGYTGGIDIKVELLKLEGSYEQVVSEK